LCDLGTAVHEKYGDFTSWKMKLRDDKKEARTILETRVSVGTGGI